MKNYFKKTVTLAGALCIAGGLFLEGCTRAYYKTVNHDFLSGIKTITSMSAMVDKTVDYSKMTWQEAIAYVKTPEQAQDYLSRHFKFDEEEAKGFNMVLFNVGGKGETFKHNHTRRKGVCLDYATVAAALLSDDGYQPLLLAMKGSGYKHIAFLYRCKGGFGCVGTTCKLPMYGTIEELIDAIWEGYKYYSIVNLDDNFKNRKWVDGDVDLQIPHLDNWLKIEREESDIEIINL